MSRLAEVFAASMLVRLKPPPAVSKYVWGFSDETLERLRQVWRETDPEAREQVFYWQLAPVEQSDERLDPLRRRVADHLSQLYKDGAASSEVLPKLKNLGNLNLYDLAVLAHELSPELLEN